MADINQIITLGIGTPSGIDFFIRDGLGAGTPPVVTGGVVWATVNGVVTPPARQTSGSQTHWMVSNGTWIVPTVKPAPRPRSFSKDRT